MKEKPDMNGKTEAERELKTIWQGVFVWIILIIIMTLGWSILFLSTELIFFGFAPPQSINLLISAVVATFISVILILLMRKRFIP